MTTGTEKCKWDIFLAHAGADAPAAEELYDLLESDCNVFLDSRCLLPGDIWDSELSKAQKQSLVTVVLVSTNSEKAYYQREEIAAAIQMSREDEEAHRVVPVFLEDETGVKTEHYGLRIRHGLSVKENGGLRGVAQKLLELLDRLRDRRSDSQPIGAMWLTSRANRLRFKGARIEVVAFIITRSPAPSLLMVESAYAKTWMPPQEGVNLDETLQDAFYRCVQDECGINIPSEPNERRKLFYLRHIEYLDMLDLPVERSGERLVADNAADTPFENIKLKRKAYWAAIAIIKNASEIMPKPDGREIVKVEWFDFDKASNLIQSTNRTEKASLLLKGIKLCERHLRGS